MIYLYGLLDPMAELGDTVAETLTGVTGPIEVTRLPEGYLFYGPHDGSEILAKRRNLLAHARALEAMIGLGTVLPMRFGMFAATVAEVAEMLRGQSDQIAAQIAKLRGLVEVGVRISFDRKDALNAMVEEAPALKAERERLLRARRGGHFEQAEFGRRLAEALERRRTNVQKELLAGLAPLVSDHVLRVPEDDAQVISADVLIDEHAQADFSQAIARLADACGFAPGSEPQIRLVGPVPPYNFVRLFLGSPAVEVA